MSEFTDGIAFTLLIVETKDSVPWTKPADLPFNGKKYAQRATPSDLSSNALYYLTADGAPHIMQPVDWDLLAKLITRNGGEVVEKE